MVSPRFRVTYPSTTIELLLKWGELAEAAGRGDAFRRALRRVHYRLQYEADSWGGVHDHLTDMALTLRRGREDMVIVYYGVHTRLPEVFVRTVHVSEGFWTSI